MENPGANSLAHGQNLVADLALEETFLLALCLGIHSNHPYQWYYGTMMPLIKPLRHGKSMEPKEQSARFSTTIS